MPMAFETDLPVADEAATYEQYRSLSRAAVTSVILAIVSLSGMLFPSLLPLALVAVIAGCYALGVLKRRSDELTGRTLALTGIVMGLLILVGGTTLHAAIYVLEVPEGYDRITYRQLQPDAGSQAPFAATAAELNGKKVFIKGYAYPGSRMDNIRAFLLVRDRGCCFGANPKLSDRIQITLSEEAKGLKYDTRLHGVAGIFRLEPKADAIDVGGAVFYHLDQAEVY